MNSIVNGINEGKNNFYLLKTCVEIVKETMSRVCFKTASRSGIK